MKGDYLHQQYSDTVHEGNSKNAFGSLVPAGVDIDREQYSICNQCNAGEAGKEASVLAIRSKIPAGIHYRGELEK